MKVSAINPFISAPNSLGHYFSICTLLCWRPCLSPAPLLPFGRATFVQGYVQEPNLGVPLRQPTLHSIIHTYMGETKAENFLNLLHLQTFFKSNNNIITQVLPGWRTTHPANDISRAKIYIFSYILCKVSQFVHHHPFAHKIRMDREGKLIVAAKSWEANGFRNVVTPGDVITTWEINISFSPFLIRIWYTNIWQTKLMMWECAWAFRVIIFRKKDFLVGVLLWNWPSLMKFKATTVTE